MTPGGGTDSGKSCKVASDCGSTSPTVECNAGVCQDPAWICIGARDDRPAATMSTASMSVAFKDTGLAPVTLPATVRACALTNAAACEPLAGATASYTPGAGITVSGLRQDGRFRLTVDPVNPQDFLGIDFYAQRPARDLTQQEGALYAFPKEIVAALSVAFGVPVRADTGTLIVMYHDCAGHWPEGVSLSFPAGELAADSRVVYLDQSNLPALDATSTTAAGIAGVVNLPTGRPLTLKSTVHGVALPDETITLQSGRVGVVHAYPRAY